MNNVKNLHIEQSLGAVRLTVWYEDEAHATEFYNLLLEQCRQGKVHFEILVDPAEMRKLKNVVPEGRA